MIMMEWLLSFSVIWLSIDIIVIATGWYLVSTIKPRCPEWWRRVVVDEEPKF